MILMFLSSERIMYWALAHPAAAGFIAGFEFGIANGFIVTLAFTR